MNKSLSEQSLSAIIWLLLDKLGSSTVNFIVTILLARLLSPEDFGLVAMVMVFFEFSSVFVESGFSTALIRQKSISEIDKSTTFIFNLISAILFYGILFVSAPAIARFFNQEMLVWIVRIMGLNLIFNAFSIIQRSSLIQQVHFKTQTKIRFLTVLISGACAILLAYRGFGVWSLVIRFGMSDLLDSILLWVLNRWAPKMQFSWESFRRLFGFGSKILAAAILDKFFTHVYKLLIGKFFAAATLGFYTQAGNFTNMVINTLFRTIQNVSYPVLSKLQDDQEQLKAGYRKILKLSSFILIPSMILLGVLAKPVILTLLGEKWLPAVPMLQLLCLSGLTYHFSTINLNMLLVLGRSDLSLKLEVIKKVNISIAILIGLQFGIYGLIIGEVISAYINLFINAYYSKKFLKYALGEQFRDVLPTLSFSVLIGAFLFYLKDLPEFPGLVYIILISIVGMLLYLLLHFLAKTEEMSLLRRTIIPKTLKIITRS